MNDNDVSLSIQDLENAIEVMEMWLDAFGDPDASDAVEWDIPAVERALDAFKRIVRLSAAIRGEKHLRLVKTHPETEET
jgi:hypothetical protein